MTIATGSIVTVNTGSSSIKLNVFEMNQAELKSEAFLSITINNIGQPVSTIQTMSADIVRSETMNLPDHVAASHILMERLMNLVEPGSIIAIGYRLVHGGVKYARPTAINAITDGDWELLAQLDSEHTPAAREIATQFMRSYPSISHVACFDTAFFSELPHIAKIIPVPKKYYSMGVRRYGFHGLSYASLLSTFREKAGETAANGRVILAHLGSGSSLTATRSGKPVDMTMGFTPTSGVIMSTRSGDLDPNIFGFLHRHDGMSIEEFDHMVSSESGLLGVSGLTGDMHALLDQEDQNEDAAAAIELFVRDIKKSIGGLAAVLGGIDSLIFSGGIGEQSAILRARICQGLGYAGIDINEEANVQNAFLISSEKSKAGVHVIATNEAFIIAAQTRELFIEKRV